VADAPPQAQPDPVISGVSQLHLGAKLGPAVGPVEAVVADAEEPLGEAQGGHQQGDAQEVDAAGAREGAFRASWAGEARRAGGGQAAG